jgi:hypothetical protein
MKHLWNWIQEKGVERARERKEEERASDLFHSTCNSNGFVPMRIIDELMMMVGEERRGREGEGCLFLSFAFRE